MLDQVLDVFSIRPDIDLDVMRPGQDLFDVTSSVLLGLRRVLCDLRPDVVLVQGDTTTCFAGALAAFYHGIAIGHVEAGLRTHDLRAPFPEEGNRALVGRLAAVHFAATERARVNLIAEGIPEDCIHVTGNTVIDALLQATRLVGGAPATRWREALGDPLCARMEVIGDDPLILITGHRRENFGARFEELCLALRELATAHPTWTFVYPVHLNPNVQTPVRAILADLPNVFLVQPQEYLPFVWLMNRAMLILTDSGGVQEEAPALGKPVLVMRDVTERPEAVEAGAAALVGTDRERIVGAVCRLVTDPDHYRRMSRGGSPYGDGHAAARIVRALTDWHGVAAQLYHKVSDFA
jgi:UDP-N-acetylglucosamine 2-epimerase (non-hydrolysing)